MNGPTDGQIYVLWIIPKAWEEELRIIPQHAPILLEQWLQIIRDEEMTVMRLPESKIAGGPCDGGHVVRVDSADDTNLFALPPDAIPALAGLLPPDDFRELVRQSGRERPW